MFIIIIIIFVFSIHTKNTQSKNTIEASPETHILGNEYRNDFLYNYKPFTFYFFFLFLRCQLNGWLWSVYTTGNSPIRVMFGATVNKSSLQIKGFKAKINILGSCKVS